MFVAHTMLSTNFITELMDLNAIQQDDKHFDFDLQVKILQMFKLDNYSSEIRVIDSSNEIWHAQILTQKFKWLREGQYVRIRQATLQNHKNYNRVFGLKLHSNILALPEICRLSSEMSLNDEQHNKKYEYEALTKTPDGHKGVVGVLPHPIIVTRLDNSKDDNGQELPLSNLMQLVEGDSSKGKPVLGLENAKQSVFRTRFAVQGFINGAHEEQKEIDFNYLNFIKVLNTKTG